MHFLTTVSRKGLRHRRKTPLDEGIRNMANWVRRPWGASQRAIQGYRNRKEPAAKLGAATFAPAGLDYRSPLKRSTYARTLDIR